MRKGGPKPKPTMLKVLQGSRIRKRPGRDPMREPIPLGNLKDPPAQIAADARLLSVWQQALAEAPPELLKRIDASILASWVAAYVLHQDALAQVMKVGLLVKSPKTETPMQSPYLPIVNKQALIMMRAIEHLGFSPAARTRIMIDEPSNGVNPWLELRGT